MIPNPVQRRHATPRVSDDLLAPCAQEGGTFRDPVPTRQAPIPEYSLPSWLAALIVLATCAACAWLGA